jgi:hypothetical protein
MQNLAWLALGLGGFSVLLALCAWIEDFILLRRKQ